MGHQRLGRLPKTLRWSEVIALLDISPADPAAIAARIMEAADRRFVRLANEPSVAYCFWLLTRVTWASRGSFLSELNGLGIPAAASDSALTLIAKIADRARLQLGRMPPSGHFGEMAALAMRGALAETVAQQGPSLFGSSSEDVQRAFRAYSRKEMFGELAHHFFANFLSRSLRGFVDRELADHLGPTFPVKNVNGSQEFMAALDLYTRQTARIARDFAGGWYSKHNWESKGDIGRDEARRFVAYALRKLRSELKRGAEAA